MSTTVSMRSSLEYCHFFYYPKACPICTVILQRSKIWSCFWNTLHALKSQLFPTFLLQQRGFKSFCKNKSYSMRNRNNYWRSMKSYSDNASNFNETHLSNVVDFYAPSVHNMFGLFSFISVLVLSIKPLSSGRIEIHVSAVFFRQPMGNRLKTVRSVEIHTSNFFLPKSFTSIGFFPKKTFIFFSSIVEKLLKRVKTQIFWRKDQGLFFKFVRIVFFFNF